MDKLKLYQTQIKQALKEYAALLNAAPPPPYHVDVAFDDEHGQYLLREIGWTPEGRVHNTVFHLALREGKIWIEEDWSEEGIASYLLAHGVPAQAIVLGFQPPALRPLTEFAVA
ncbi:MAG: XisI protein [Caldilineaceae bacterium]